MPFLRTRLAVLMLLQFTFPGALLQLFSIHLEETLGFDPCWTGVCGATQALGSVLVALVVGHIADRWYSAERVLSVCSVLAGITLLVLAEVTSFPAVFITMLVFWLLAGPVVLLGTTICFTQLTRPDRDYRLVRLWGTVGWMIPGWLLLAWNLIDGNAGGAATVTNLFRVGAGFGFVLGLYALTLPATPPRRESEQRSAPLAALRLLRGWSFAVYAICTFGVCVTVPFTNQATPLLLGRLGIPRIWISPTLTLAQVSEITCLVLLPALFLRFQLRGTMILGLIAWTSALTILALGSPVALVVGSLLFNGMCVSGFMVSGQMFVNRTASDGLRASAQALLTFVNATGLLLGHLLAGFLRSDGDLLGAFGIAAGISGSVLLLFFAGFRERRAAPVVENWPAIGTVRPVVRVEPEAIRS